MEKLGLISMLDLVALKIHLLNLQKVQKELAKATLAIDGVKEEKKIELKLLKKQLKAVENLQKPQL